MNNKSFILLLIDKFVLLLISGFCLYYAIHIALIPPTTLPNGTIVPHVATSNETTLLGSLIAFLAGAQGFLWSSLRSELKEVFGTSEPFPKDHTAAQSVPLKNPSGWPVLSKSAEIMPPEPSIIAGPAGGGGAASEVQS